MRRATTFMVERVATDGGYVWSYLPDLSRRWGEIEADPSMIWVQPPGTATMGHLFLDAYHATGDEYYYRAAAGGGRRPDPRPAPQRRLELFHRLRRPGLDAALVRDDRPQRLADGGIPALFRQCDLRRCRHGRGDAAPAAHLSRAARSEVPRRRSTGRSASCSTANIRTAAGRSAGRTIRGYPAYARYITFNDDVAAENIRFLLMVYQSLGEARVQPTRSCGR